MAAFPTDERQKRSSESAYHHVDASALPPPLFHHGDGFHREGGHGREGTQKSDAEQQVCASPKTCTKPAAATMPSKKEPRRLTLKVAQGKESAGIVSLR